MSKKSFIAKIEELILKMTKPKYMNSQKEVEIFLKNKKDVDFKTIFPTIEYNNSKLLIIGKNEESDHVVLYLHGGAYVNELNMQHTLYCYILSKILNTHVIAPAYPLTPAHDYKDTFELITQLYSDLTEKYEHVTLMGDSAGGGFVLSFCQYLNRIQFKQPDNIIVFSPWVDISMKNNYDDSEDVILGNIGLREIGKHWANKIDAEDYRVSPLYGDNHNLPRTLIFTGSGEIFYKDILEYYEKLVEDDVDCELVIGEDLFHIYPLFPIPEAINVFKKIKKEIELFN